jgi:nucleotide-binding universal stress UspA family protein
MTRQATIVVGVDGSACSRSALEFALEEAARRAATVRVLWAIRAVAQREPVLGDRTARRFGSARHH